VIVAAGFGADLMSGIVHWTADTWGSETCPVFGRRFLRPFRVHHVNPHDFLRRDVVDCNGDVAMLNLPMLAGALLIPLATGAGQIAAVALVAFCAVMLPTNQVHQWAHMTSPPRLVRWLQRAGLILSHEEHGRHHIEPYVANYCIATGWCNRALTAIGFFSILERTVTMLTGIQPRHDEQHLFLGLQSAGPTKVGPCI
jgi:ubiquitin-conjugating enzyme E2 variant